MKYLKTYESIIKNEANWNLEDAMTEINLEKDIIGTMKELGLEELDVEINDNKKYKMHIYFEEWSGNLTLWKLLNGKREEIMVGIPRYKGPKILSKILNYLKNMTPEEVDFEKTKNSAKKYNL